MQVTPCTRCTSGWDKAAGRCTVEVGVEHLPDEPEAPTCPIQDRCQHQVQASPDPCIVRRKGMICESALIYAGMPEDEARGHPLGFSAMTVCD
jgi:hypothetical protein